jgi:hypothetical protein
LTIGERKANIDGIGEIPAWEIVLAELARQLTAEPAAGVMSPLEAVVAARDLARAVDRAMRAAVERAREMGHTWQDIGEVLGTSRQAAFQRFGRPLDPRTGVPMAEALLPDAANRAATLIADLTQGQWEAVCRDFDQTVASRLGATELAAVWARVIGMVGGYERMGEPLAYQAGDYTIVDIPLSFEAGERCARVSYDRHGKIAGLFILPSEPR